MIRKLLHYIIKRYQLQRIIEELQEKDKIALCNAKVNNKGGSFYPESRVDNFQNDRNSIEIGLNTHVRGELLVWKHGGKITIGQNCYIGSGTKIWSGSIEGVAIGNNVLISHNVTVIDSDSHEIDYLERAKGFAHLINKGHRNENTTVKTAPIVIEDHAWISYNVSILKGVRIGKGAIIGAGSVVSKDIPEFTLAIGNPAIIVKQLNNEFKKSID